MTCSRFDADEMNEKNKKEEREREREREELPWALTTTGARLYRP